MPAELDNIDSEMDQPEMDQPEMDSEPVGGTIGLHGDETDREGAMAKADLFKIANYAHKLYQQLEDNDQLESWVQAKITKAADYIASVYHYLEYEMKFSEYGHHLDNSDTLSEGQKMRIKELLSEAKSKVKELKKAQAEKVSEEKSSTGGEIDRSTKGVTKHKENPKRFSDEEHTEPKSQAKSQSAADKAGDKAADKAEEKEGKSWQKRFGKDSVTRIKDGKKVDEALKGGQKKLDTDNDDDIDAKDLAALRARKKVKESVGKKDCPPMSHIKKMCQDGKSTAEICKMHPDCDQKELKQMVADCKKKLAEGSADKCNHTAKGKSCPVHGLKECGMEESATKTMSRAAKGHEKYGKEGMAALAKAGKEGKSLEPIKAKYNKYDEAAAPTKDLPKKGSKIGKEGNAFSGALDDAKDAGEDEFKVGGKTFQVKESNKATAAAMWKNMKETTAYMAERKKKEKVTDENLTVVPNPSGADSADRAKELGAMMPAPAGKKDPISTTKESFDLTRMRQLTGRLNQNEKPALVENREVDQIRALTKRLLG